MLEDSGVHGVVMEQRLSKMQAWRKALVFLSCCLLYVVPFSTDLTSGIPYSELLLEPCGQNDTSVEEVVESRTETSVLDIGLVARRVVLREDGGNTFDTTALPTPTAEYYSSATRHGNNVPQCGGFGQGASRTAWVASIYSTVRVATSWMNGVSYDVFGGRRTALAGLTIAAAGCLASSFASSLYVLYVTRGLVAGIGGGLLYHLAVPILDKVFTRRKALVLTLCAGSSGIGVLLIAFLGKQAIEYGGWRWYYRMLTLLIVLSMTSVFFIPADSESGGTENRRGGVGGKNRNSSSWPVLTNQPPPLLCWSKLQILGREIKSSFLIGLSLYKNLGFTLVATSISVGSIFWLVPYLSARHRSQAIAGATDADGFLQIILIGVWAFVGSASSGLAIEFLSVPKVFAQCVIFAFLSLASGLNALVTTQLSLHIYVSVFAFLANGVAAFVAPTMLEIVRKDQLPHANGQVILLCSISVLAGPPISGWLYEISGSYTLPVTIAAVTFAIASFIMLLLAIHIHRRSKREKMSGTAKFLIVSTGSTSEKPVLVCTSL